MVNFTAKEISTILRACRDTNVSEFSCGDLKLVFHSAASTPPIIEPTLLQPGLSQEVQDEIQKSFEADDDLQDIELQTLMISDPLAYEKAMRYDLERPSEAE